jgi:integrase
VKSEAGVRRVPIHPRLIELGFSEYVADQRKAGAALVFDRIPSSATRSASENFSDAFRELCQDAEVYQRWRHFHALRTSVSTALRGVYPALDESLIDAIMGHEGASVGRSHYTVHAPRTLLRVVEHLQYPAVQALPRVYLA